MSLLVLQFWGPGDDHTGSEGCGFGGSSSSSQKPNIFGQQGIVYSRLIVFEWQKFGMVENYFCGCLGESEGGRLWKMQRMVREA